MASTNDSLCVAIEELKIELGKVEELESLLSEKEASFHRLKDEINNVKSEEQKESEKNIYDLFVSQSKEFEEAKILLEESRKQIKHLLAKLQTSDDRLKRLEVELQWTKEQLCCAEEDGEVYSIEAENLAEEVSYLKNELKSIADAEEHNKKAMDDLAFALKKVTTEAKEAKNKLSSTQNELERTKGYAENLKMKLRILEGKYNEAKKEGDRFKNRSERLRIEAEESLSAWNTREIGFVDCIRKAEDERNAAKEETRQLLKSLEQTENLNKKAKEENQKLRDIMKQAINEANVAKEAANIARAENSLLKDAIARKDEALNFLSQENETLKINEAAANEIIRELKMLFCKL